MGRYFEESYSQLRRSLDDMAAMVLRVLGSAMEALATRDVELARRVVDEDELIDRIEVEIDELVLKILALQQPMAVDLRYLVTALKVCNDLERMGDQATNIARAVLHLEAQQPAAEGNLVDFGPIGVVVTEMVRGSVEAFAVGDATGAKALVGRDDEVDAMHRAIIASLAAHARQHPDDAERCMSLLLVTRNLERLGDLATNVAEEVVYYVEGKIIKHSH